MINTGEGMLRSFGEDYDDNIIFTELSYMMSFYDSLSVCHIPSFEYTAWFSKSKIFSTPTYIYNAIAGTIESISVLLRNGRCNDAFALVRKYCDSIILDIYKILLTKRIDNQFYESLSFDVYENNELKKWIDSEDQLYSEREIKSKVYNEIIKNFPALTKMFKLNAQNTLYHKLRTICNDNMHYNYFWTIFANDAEMIKARKEFRDVILKNISKALRLFFTIHFSLIYEGAPGYMASSDYMDYLDMGQQPPEGSERWVSPPVLEAFIKIIKKYYPKIADYIINLDLLDFKD